jgi:hypothetical protein
MMNHNGFLKKITDGVKVREVSSHCLTRMKHNENIKAVNTFYQQKIRTHRFFVACDACAQIRADVARTIGEVHQNKEDFRRLAGIEKCRTLTHDRTKYECDR